MWSLPDIKRLNDEAALRAKKDKKKTVKQLLRGKRCEHCDEKATVLYEYYDIFSDDPKGYIYLCEKHDGYYGSPDEGYFTCDDCNRVFVENYTWENYYHADEDGMICLNCFFDREIDNEENWITDPLTVTFDTVQKAKHLIPVAGKHWEKHLDFLGNVEFDSMSGKELYGTRESGMGELIHIMREANKPCILILDAAYQFSVSIGVYTRKEEIKSGKDTCVQAKC